MGGVAEPPQRREDKYKRWAIVICMKWDVIADDWGNRDRGKVIIMFTKELAFPRVRRK